jgi:hypothetical protein
MEEEEEVVVVGEEMVVVWQRPLRRFNNLETICTTPTRRMAAVEASKTIQLLPIMMKS